jgi:hypothetical protein
MPVVGNVQANPKHFRNSNMASSQMQYHQTIRNNGSVRTQDTVGFGAIHQVVVLQQLGRV